MKVFVAGHRGFIGRNICESLRNDYELVTRNREELNLEDKLSVELFLRKSKPDAVIFTAGIIPIYNSTDQDAVKVFQQNMNMQTNVLQGSAKYGIANVINLSSSAVYESLNVDSPHEDDAMKLMNPISISDGYAKSKIEGLKLSSRLNSGASQFHSLILSNIYGPYDHFFDDRSLFIPLLMKKIRKAIIDNEVVIKFNSDLSNSLDLFHVADVTKVVRLFLDRELNYPILNVGNGRGEKLIEVAKQMMEIAGYRGTLVPGTEVVSKNKRPIMNVDLLNKASLDISQTLREGLTETYDWFTKQD